MLKNTDAREKKKEARKGETHRGEHGQNAHGGKSGRPSRSGGRRRRAGRCPGAPRVLHGPRSPKFLEMVAEMKQEEETPEAETERSRRRVQGPLLLPRRRLHRLQPRLTC